MDGDGQQLERRFRLPLWRESNAWMQARCCDLVDADQHQDAKSLYSEFEFEVIQ